MLIKQIWFPAANTGTKLNYQAMIRFCRCLSSRKRTSVLMNVAFFSFFKKSAGCKYIFMFKKIELSHIFTHIQPLSTVSRLFCRFIVATWCAPFSVEVCLVRIFFSILGYIRITYFSYKVFILVIDLTRLKK